MRKLGVLVDRIRLMANERLRRVSPGGSVTRVVQGTRLHMPRRHLLPDIVRRFPSYGQNLVVLAEELARAEGGAGWSMIDVGANIGDSTRQVLDRVPIEAWCIEGDSYWLPFLERNVGDSQQVWILPALLVTSDDGEAEGLSPVRTGGTTTFRPGEGNDSGTARYRVDELAGMLPLGRPVRLVKSDTDGFDTRLVPALAHAFRDSSPVLFFEYDPELTRKAGDGRPDRVWEHLADLGYSEIAIWDNFGGWLTRLKLADVALFEAEFGREPAERGFHYWDVMAVHADDRPGLDALDAIEATSAGRAE